jgi:hypothetical protein
VRIEARDEPSKHERKASEKTTATAKTLLRKNKSKSNDKNLDNVSRLIEAALIGSQRISPSFAGGYLQPRQSVVAKDESFWRSDFKFIKRMTPC